MLFMFLSCRYCFCTLVDVYEVSNEITVIWDGSDDNGVIFKWQKRQKYYLVKMLIRRVARKYKYYFMANPVTALLVLYQQESFIKPEIDIL